MKNDKMLGGGEADFIWTLQLVTMMDTGWKDELGAESALMDDDKARSVQPERVQVDHRMLMTTL